MANTGLFPGWRVVVGSGCGLAFGSVIFASGAFSQLASAWGHEFSWTQPQLAKAATLFLFLQMATYPIVGWLLDRWGSRKVACASILLFALSLAALSQIGNSLGQFYAAFALIGLVSAGTNVVSYARAISLWFDRKRGLALGLAAGSQAVGAILVPMLAAQLIASFGWSSAVLSFAAVQLAFCLPLVRLLVKDSPAPYGLLPDGDSSDVRQSVGVKILIGPSRSAVIQSPTFWKLALSFSVMGLIVYAIVINVVFILSKTAGLSPSDVAKVQAVGGAAVLVGRVGFGYLLDKLHGPWVGIIMLIASGFGIALFAMSPTPALIYLGAFLIWAAIGGESDLMPYLASRYFGTRSLSSVFGWFLAAFFIGAAVGPTAFSVMAQMLNSVALPLWMLVALQAVPAAVFLWPGRYPTKAELSIGTGAPTVAGAAQPELVAKMP